MDTASGFGTGQFAPQYRGQCEAHQIIQRTTRTIGIDQIVIQRPRIGHGFGDRRFRDRVKGYAVDLFWERFLFPQNFLHMPANRFPFPVRVGRENKARGLFGQVGNRLELLGLVRIGLPQHGKAVVRIN